MISSGFPLNSIGEIRDMHQLHLKCDETVGFERYAAVGSLLEGNHLMICGGKGSNGQFQTCTSKNLDNGNLTEVPMISKRYAASSVSLNDSFMWIVGGSDDTRDLSTSEFISVKHGSTLGPLLPFTVRFHCLVLINSSTVFLIGGNQNGITSNKVWIFNPTNDFSIVPGNKMVIKRRTHACSRMTDDYENALVMVAGGINENGDTLDSTEIFNISSNEWISG